MSKKLAEGIDALVLDVKTGSGAFMRKEEDSVALAEVMVDTAKRMGKKCVALITDMGQPLGRFAGHSNEVIESIEILKAAAPPTSATSAWNFPPGCFFSASARQVSTKAAPSQTKWSLPAKPSKNSATAFASRAAIPA